MNVHQKQLKADAKRPIDVNAYLTGKAFIKSEAVLLEKALVLANSLPAHGVKDYLFVGGVPLRHYISEKYKGRMGSGICMTDVDIAMPALPLSIKDLCKEENVVKPKILLRQGMHGQVTKIIPQKGVGTVFHLKEMYEHAFPIFYDVCFFESQVGRIQLSADDYAKAVVQQIEYATKEANYLIELKFPDLGLLLATLLTPQAITETRARRATFALLSNSLDIEAITHRLVDVAKRNDMKEAELQEVFNFFYHVATRHAESLVKDFFAILIEAGIPKSVFRI